MSGSSSWKQARRISKPYKETRRRHPMSDSYPNLLDAINAEIELMSPLRDIADFVINTSQMNVHELVARIKEIISTEDRTEVCI